MFHQHKQKTIEALTAEAHTLQHWQDTYDIIADALSPTTERQRDAFITHCPDALYTDQRTTYLASETTAHNAVTLHLQLTTLGKTLTTGRRYYQEKESHLHHLIQVYNARFKQRATTLEHHINQETQRLITLLNRTFKPYQTHEYRHNQTRLLNLIELHQFLTLTTLTKPNPTLVHYHRFTYETNQLSEQLTFHHTIDADINETEQKHLETLTQAIHTNVLKPLTTIEKKYRKKTPYELLYTRPDIRFAAERLIKNLQRHLTLPTRPTDYPTTLIKPPTVQTLFPRYHLALHLTTETPPRHPTLQRLHDTLLGRRTPQDPTWHHRATRATALLEQLDHTITPDEHAYLDRLHTALRRSCDQGELTPLKDEDHVKTFLDALAAKTQQ